MMFPTVLFILNRFPILIQTKDTVLPYRLTVGENAPTANLIILILHECTLEIIRPD